MPLTFQSVKLAPNDSHTFTFDQTVYAYQVGVASFLFSFGKGDHHIKELGLSISSNKAGSQNNQIAVRLDGVLKDGSGNEMDNSKSYVVVVCLAWVGSSTPYTVFSGPLTVGNNQQSNPVFIPANPSILQSNLSGFSLTYADDDHHVQGVAAGMGVSINNNQAQLDGVARMWDASGHDASNPTATGNLIASNDANPGFIIKPVTAEQGTGTMTIQMGKALSNATSLLTGFQVQFGGDHHVLQIGAGNDSAQVDSSNKTQVLTSGIWAWVLDSSGNTTDLKKSSCSIVVIGTLA